MNQLAKCNAFDIRFNADLHYRWYWICVIPADHFSDQANFISHIYTAFAKMNQHFLTPGMVAIIIIVLVIVNLSKFHSASSKHI